MVSTVHTLLLLLARRLMNPNIRRLPLADPVSSSAVFVI
jgi:hypothetical protein